MHTRQQASQQDITQRLITLILGWDGVKRGETIEELHAYCRDVIAAQEPTLVPAKKLFLLEDLTESTLMKALKPLKISAEISLNPYGTFDLALIPINHDDGPTNCYYFALNQKLSIHDQLALYAHGISHLIKNYKERSMEQRQHLNPASDTIHVDSLAELRFLDILQTRNQVDRKVLEDVPELAALIQLPEETSTAQDSATVDLSEALRSQGWKTNSPYLRKSYRYTDGRVLPNSARRGKRASIDALLLIQASLPTAIVHQQRSTETIPDALRRVRTAGAQLSVPFGYLYTQDQDVLEYDWTNDSLSDVQRRDTLPTREELQSRWFAALQLTDKKAHEALHYPFQIDKKPRYYQEAAINRAVIATLQARRGLRNKRILLTLATGTGKTLVAFQILWKLKRTREVRNILFLADRSYLLDQAQYNAFGPFGDAITRGSSTADTAHDILFGSYQWLTMLENDDLRYKKYPSDYFDVIVIDECHRGSANENSQWRQVLQHFSPAVQIGLTATPLETKDVQTNQYFGDPIYTYSLSDGINDGYLAPYRVRRVRIGEVDATTTTTDHEGPVENLDQTIVMETGRVMKTYTRAIAEHLALYLQQTDTRARTIIFCVDNQHALEMREALIQTCSSWARPGDIVRIVDDEGAEGKRALSNFCTPRERQPLIVTTSRLLSTGIDVPTCKNVVLARGVGSIVEFKQIIGRGTRLFGEEKRWFTIVDYAGTIKHFFDGDFDGGPDVMQNEPLLPTPNTISYPQTKTTPQTTTSTHTTTTPTSDPIQPNNTSSTPDNSQSITALPILDTAQPTPAPTNPSDNYHQQSTPQSTTVHETSPAHDTEPSAPITSQSSQPMGKPIESRIPPQTKPSTQPSTGYMTIRNKNNNTRFEAQGEFFYELAPDGRQLRQGTYRDFTAQAISELVKTPAELNARWLIKEQRQEIIDQVEAEFVALDALADSLHLQELDYLDLLNHIVFQAPTLTRAQRVANLRTQHSSFFQRYANNPTALWIFDTILDKYTQGLEPDISKTAILTVPPLNTKTQHELNQALKKDGPAAAVVLKELQRLLYS